MEGTADQEDNRRGGMPTVDKNSLDPRKRKSSILPHLYPHVPNHPLSPAPARCACTQLAGNEAFQPQDTHNIPSNHNTSKKIQALEEAELLAMAKVSPYIYQTVYKTDFHRTAKTEESSSTNDEVKPKPVPKTLLQTSMLQDYQTPQVIASLRNKTTRYGYKQHVIAKGAVPAMDNDMYRTPEFITSQYHQQFTHPNKR